MSETKTEWLRSVSQSLPLQAIANPCFCRGRQNGEPVCPCRMRNVEIRDGRYVEIVDHGPAPAAKAGKGGDHE